MRAAVLKPMKNVQYRWTTETLLLPAHSCLAHGHPLTGLLGPAPLQAALWTWLSPSSSWLSDTRLAGRWQCYCKGTTAAGVP